MFFCRLLQIVSALLVVALAAGQREAQGATTVFGEFSVQLTVEGQPFTFRLSPELDSAGALAEQFCRSQANRIGVTTETFARCIDVIGNRLQASIDGWYDKKRVSSKFFIGGKEYEVRIVPELESPAAIADSVCQNYRVMGFTELKDCLPAVEEHFKREITQWLTERTLFTPLVVDDKELEVRFLPERQSTTDVAVNVCRQQAAALQLTDDLFPTCVDLIDKRLRVAAQKWLQSKTLQFSLNIANQEVRFSFMPERESAESVALNFCVNNANALQLTQETLAPRCVAPLQAEISRAIERWVKSEVVSLPIDVDGQTVKISFFPERETTVRVARRFCITNAEVLNLTEENYVDQCVTPVNAALIKAAQEHYRALENQA